MEFFLLLQQLPYYVREDAANSLYLEAKSRIEDPVYGCVGIISKLYQQIHDTQLELAKIQTQTQIAFDKLQKQFQDESNDTAIMSCPHLMLNQI